MKTLYLVHWHEQEAKEKAAALRKGGYTVRCERIGEQTSLKDLRADPPDAFVIDLSRLPSHGREVAMALRQSKATRCVPLVFVDGAAEKVQRVRDTLPDAVFTTWPKIGSAIKSALRKPPSDPVMPRSDSGPHSGVPLAKKLGLKPGCTISLIDAPDNVTSILGQLPDGASLLTNARKACDFILWFARSQRDLDRRIESIAKRVGEGNVWIIWPKKTSNLKSDLTGDIVRNTGLAHGLVDFKVCAVDETWSGLRFSMRR